MRSMIGTARTGDVIDFFWEWQKRQAARRRNTVAEVALDNARMRTSAAIGTASAIGIASTVASED